MYIETLNINKGCQSGLVVSKLDSRSKGCGLKPWKNGVKAIPAPNSGSFE